MVLQVVACRLDGHTCVVNSVALALAGIHRDTPELPGGIIVKDRNGGMVLKVKLTARLNNFSFDEYFRRFGDYILCVWYSRGAGLS